MSSNAGGPVTSGAEVRDRLDDSRLADLAREIARERGRRRRMLSAIIPNLSDAAWAMLLDIFVAEAEDRDAYTTSVCLVADVPVTTALRQLMSLASSGVVVRTSDRNDARRILVTLSPHMRGLVETYLRQVDRDRRER